MPASYWIPIVVTAFSLIAGWIGMWAIWVSRRIVQLETSVLTREEHDRICEQKDKDIQDTLTDIKKSINERFENVQIELRLAQESRYRQNNLLHKIQIHLAVLTATTKGVPATTIEISQEDAP